MFRVFMATFCNDGTLILKIIVYHIVNIVGRHLHPIKWMKGITSVHVQTWNSIYQSENEIVRIAIL